MNHHGLFLKLMQKQIPLKLLCILENWFKLWSKCIKWDSVVSRVFSVDCGVRQGGVLSPYLFALYTDSIVDRIRNSRIGCYLIGLYMSVLLYANDILLIAPSVSSVNKLLHICEQEVTLLDMAINAKKCMCTNWLSFQTPLKHSINFRWERN